MRWLIGFIVLIAASVACTIGAAPPTAVPTPLPTFTQNATLDLTATNAVASGLNTLQPTPGQACVPRSDWPTTVVLPGDTLSGIAQRAGTTVDDLVAANCLASADAIVAGQSLRVPVAPSNPTPALEANPPADCPGGSTWFFAFNYAQPDSNCPGQLITSNAVGQNFQNGRIYRYDPAPGESQATIYAIYNDGTWAKFPDTWDSSQPMDDPNIVPPQGWYKPTGALGKLWREQLKDKLGWAYSPEDTFTGRRQAPANDASYFYIDHGLRRLVLRLSNVNGTPSDWQVVGSY